jgi:hypothetical protein
MAGALQGRECLLAVGNTWLLFLCVLRMHWVSCSRSVVPLAAMAGPTKHQRLPSCCGCSVLLCRCDTARRRSSAAAAAAVVGVGG